MKQFNFSTVVLLTAFLALDCVALALLPRELMGLWFVWLLLVLAKIALYPKLKYLIHTPLFTLVFFYNSFSLAYYHAAYFLLADNLIPNYTQYSLVLVALLGQLGLLLTLLLLRRPQKWTVPSSSPAIQAPTLILGYLALCFSVSYIAYALGIARMGGEAITLAFGATGILNVFRIMVLPLLALLFVVDAKRFRLTWILAYMAWLLLEAYLRASRGALFNGLLPLAVYYFYTRGFNRRAVVLLSGIVAFGLALYPVITMLRSTDSLDSIEFGSSVFALDIFAVFKRVFLAGHISNVSLGLYPDSIFFGASASDIIAQYGSFSKYVTYHIDGFAVDAVHSSGMAFHAESILVGGVVAFIVYSVALLTVCRSAERRAISPAKKTLLFVLIYNMLQQGFVEFVFFQYQYLAGWCLAVGIIHLRERALVKGAASESGRGLKLSI